MKETPAQFYARQHTRLELVTQRGRDQLRLAIGLPTAARQYNIVNMIVPAPYAYLVQIPGGGQSHGVLQARIISRACHGRILVGVLRDRKAVMQVNPEIPDVHIE